MAFPQVIPHSDGAGEVVAVGARRRSGPHWHAGLAVECGLAARPWHRGRVDRAAGASGGRLPDGTSFAEGACLGIPAVTAWYALFRDGPIAGRRCWSPAARGRSAAMPARWRRLGGARVIATVSSAEKAAHAGAAEWVNYRETDVAEAVLEMTGGAGVDRIVEVDFAANQAASLALIKPGGTIAAYASASRMTPELQFYPFMFKNVTLHMLIVYQLDPATHARGAAQLTDWLAQGALFHAVVPAGKLADCAAAHETVEAGEKLGTVVLEV
jgi:NADPH2:quinone reductase